MSAPPRGKRPVKKTDAAQKKRFVEMAKKLGGDESPEGFDRMLMIHAKNVGSKRPKKR